MSDSTDPIVLMARIESAEQENARLRALVSSYEKMDTIPPPVAEALAELTSRFDQVEIKVSSVITHFEAHQGIMERVVNALQSEPRCADCPQRAVRFSSIPGGKVD